jgi:hypothetical protein
VAEFDAPAKLLTIPNGLFLNLVENTGHRSAKLLKNLSSPNLLGSPKEF